MRALTNEPLFEGEPILAVAAVDEVTAAEAIERIDAGSRAAAVRGRSAREPAAGQRERPARRQRAGRRLRGAAGATWKGRRQPDGDQDAEMDRRGFRRGRRGAAADGRGRRRVERSAISRPASRTPRSSSTKRSSCRPRAIRRWKRAARWRTGRTASCICTARRRARSARVDGVASWVGVDPSDVVFISEYTGGGFGSKGGGAVSMAIPALLARKANAPVMMRISREEEHYIGHARTNMTGRARVGFRADGRIMALDLFIVQDNGARGERGDHRSAGAATSLIYQPVAMRWRAINVITNTPTRLFQRSPGEMQGIAIVEQAITKAAKQLGIDQVAIRRINAPAGKAPFGPAAATARVRYTTSAFVKEALDRGAERFNWNERVARAGQRNGNQGPRRRRRRRHAHRGIHRPRRPDDDSAGRQAVRAERRRQPRHAFAVRPRARRRRRAGDAVGAVSRSSGATPPSTCRTRACRSAARRRTR